MALFSYLHSKEHEAAEGKESATPPFCSLKSDWALSEDRAQSINANPLTADYGGVGLTVTITELLMIASFAAVLPTATTVIGPELMNADDGVQGKL